MIKRTLFVFVLPFLVLFSVRAFCVDEYLIGMDLKNGYEPWESVITSDHLDASRPYILILSEKSQRDSDMTILNLGIYWKLWTNYFTKLDGPRSALRPSTSRYAYLAIQKYGFAKGSILAGDRWMRSHQYIKFGDYPFTEEGYYYDPVEDNVSF